MVDAALTVTGDAVGYAVLRRTVRALCAATALPLDRVDDVAIVCEELLGRGPAEATTFQFRVSRDRVDVTVPSHPASEHCGPIVEALASEIAETDDAEAGPLLRVALTT